MKVHLSAVGCRLNEAELESWAKDFRRQGHRLVNQADDADLMVFNSCAVTCEAARKSRQSINRLHRLNPDAKMVVSGCFATLSQQEVSSQSGVNLVVENRDKDRLAPISQHMLSIPSASDATISPEESTLFARNRQRAFIKIQDGCRYRCTFCIVTVARGEERSRPVKEIIDEINRHVAAGVKEIVLTGVHVGGYGSDNGSDLSALVKTIIRDTEIPRIRFASVEPWDLPDNFFELFESSRLMPHMHLPVQSGSDAILRKMARRCKTDEFRRLIQHIRDTVPGFLISTDIIAGFPGETAEHWQQTLEFVKEMRFSHIHIFSYSPRLGTKAASLAGQVDPQTKKQRSRELHVLADHSKQDILRRNIALQHEVLWEAARPSTHRGFRVFSGYTPNYLRVEAQVPDSVDLENRIGGFQALGIREDGQCLIGKTTTC